MDLSSVLVHEYAKGPVEIVSSVRGLWRPNFFGLIVPNRAHDIAFTKRVGSAEPIRVGSAFTRERFVTTPVAWKRVADATTIAALQVPGADGTKVDVFKSSVAVAREVGDFLARRL